MKHPLKLPRTWYSLATSEVKVLVFLTSKFPALSETISQSLHISGKKKTANIANSAKVTTELP